MFTWAPEKAKIFNQLKQVLLLSRIPLEHVKLFGSFLEGTFNDIDLVILDPDVFAMLLYRSEEFEPKLHPVLARSKEEFSNWHLLQSFYINCKTVSMDGSVQEVKGRIARGCEFNYKSLDVFNITAKILQSSVSSFNQSIHS